MWTLSEPPGPNGAERLRMAKAFLSRHGIPMIYLRYLSNVYGDVVRLKLGSRTLYLVTHPDLAQELLVRRYQEFHKPSAAGGPPRQLSRFLGSGILTADHDAWRPQRRLIQPLMHAVHIRSYADTMTQQAEAMMNTWRAGETRDVHADMNQVTMWIIAETMFGTKPENTADIHHLMNMAQAIAVGDLQNLLPWRDLFGRINRRVAHINTTFDKMVRQLIDERAGQSDSRNDLLTLLINSVDEKGEPVSYEFIRDNILTLFVAGHETTANTLTWALYYLAHNPAALARLRAELDAALAGRAATLADLAALPYTEMVLKETMRIEPTVSLVPRYIPENTTLGGYQLSAGSVVLVSIYCMHHDERWWDAPEEFRPERFAPAQEEQREKHAYLPFGSGPRICIGNHFAMMEAHIILATLLARWDFALNQPAEVERVRLVTTSPQGGLRMTVTPRAGIPHKPVKASAISP